MNKILIILNYSIIAVMAKIYISFGGLFSIYRRVPPSLQPKKHFPTEASKIGDRAAW